jgi:DNA polymerase I-like protein with 3'-5' exonuclease and polymerase domains
MPFGFGEKGCISWSSRRLLMPIDPTQDPTELDEDGLNEVFDLMHENRDVAKPVPNLDADDDDGTSATDFLDNNVLQEREVPDITKPWMKHHNFVLVRTLEEVNGIVDAALANGHCSLDLECEGLDNRIFYTEMPPDIDPVSGVERKVHGKPYTKHKVVGFCLAVGDAKTGYYIPIRHTPLDGGVDLNVKPVEEVEAAIKRLCLAAQPIPKPGVKDPLAFREFEKPPQVIIDFWHSAFDQEFLFPITGIDFWHPDGFEDGNLAAFVKYSGDRNLGLKAKSAEMLRDPDGHPYEMIELKELFPHRGSKIEFHLLAPDEPGVIKYGCSDGICTRLICAHKDLVPLVKEKYNFTYRLEKQVAQVKRAMERHRVKINRTRIIELRAQHEKARDEIRAKIQEFAQSKGFNSFEPGSPKQLSDMLFGKDPGLDITLPGRGPDDADFPNGKPPMNEKSKQYKTGADVLDEMAKIMGDNAPPILKWIVAFREEDKMLGTYLDSLANHPDAGTDELRFQFKQTGAATGRFSAPAGDNAHGYSGVPIHGIPATSDIRTCFVAREGYTMVKCDYSGEELRIVTNLSNERVWIKEFHEGTGDLHSITARAFFGKQEVSKDERKMGKIANFALVYGGGPAAVMRATGCDRMEGQRRKQAFDKAVPDFAKWVKVQHAKVKKELGVWTAFGRWIQIPDACSPDNAIKAACERHATNYPIQGSGADIMKIAMVLVHKEMWRRGWLQDDSVRLLLTVHDELVFEIKHARVVEAVPLIVEQMELPTMMARPPYSPQWQVPLVTEPLVGPTWGTGYPCERATEAHKLKEGEVVVNGFVYGAIRTVDLGKEIPGVGEVEHHRDEKNKKVKIRILEPQWLVGVSDMKFEPAPPPKKDESGGGGGGSNGAGGPGEPQRASATESTKNGASKTATLKLKLLTKQSVQQVRGLCMEWIDPDHGVLLKLIDPVSGQILIDPKHGVRINAEKFRQAMFEKNLSDGKMVVS